MLRQFYMNGDLWRVQFVSPHDSVLIDRTGNPTGKFRGELHVRRRNSKSDKQ